METSRRELIGQAAKLVTLAAALKAGLMSGFAVAENLYGSATAFRDDFVRNLARDLAGKPSLGR